MPPLLAHGALGIWDEVLLLAAAGAFIAMMIVSWLKSRGQDDERPESASDPDHTPLA
jgi:hypothetical protein